MEKVIRDGKVAVLVSSGYGAGWYSWNDKYVELLYHPKLVELVENLQHDKITEDLVKKILNLNNDDYLYVGGARDLDIEWINEGTHFMVDEYDGSESIKLLEEVILIA